MSEYVKTLCKYTAENQERKMSVFISDEIDDIVPAAVAKLKHILSKKGIKPTDITVEVVGGVKPATKSPMGETRQKPVEIPSTPQTTWERPASGTTFSAVQKCSECGEENVIFGVKNPDEISYLSKGGFVCNGCQAKHDPNRVQLEKLNKGNSGAKPDFSK